MSQVSKEQIEQMRKRGLNNQFPSGDWRNEAEEVKVKSLVSKKIGKCGNNIVQTLEYNPCKTVSQGEILKGFIKPSSNEFYPIYRDANSKPILQSNEYILAEKNDIFSNKNLLILAVIVGGYFAYKKFKK